MSGIEMLEKEKATGTESEKELYLFVCTGNTCRSPMAEAVFNNKYADETRFAESAGISATGEPISMNAKCALMERGILPTREENYLSHVSRKLTERLIKRATHVVAVSSTHAMLIISMFPAYASKVSVLPRDIPDPFGGNMDTYRYCLSEIELSLKEAFGEGGTGMISGDDV